MGNYYNIPQEQQNSSRREMSAKKWKEICNRSRGGRDGFSNKDVLMMLLYSGFCITLIVLTIWFGV